MKDRIKSMMSHGITGPERVKRKCSVCAPVYERKNIREMKPLFFLSLAQTLNTQVCSLLYIKFIFCEQC
jgi:hypothetical protein